MQKSESLLYLENSALRVGISPLGAEMRLLYAKNGAFDVLKSQNDPTWDGCSPILFPICGRLWEQTTTVDGVSYRMATHGFASTSRFTLSEHSDMRALLTLTDSEDTRSRYPFSFHLSVEYRLEGNSLVTRLTVENPDSKPLPFSVGFHPGFVLPLGGTGKKTDAFLDFPHAERPQAWRLTAEGYLRPGTDPYPLAEGRYLPITDEVFAENSSVFLEGTGASVLLRSHASAHTVRLDYAGLPYLGLWRPEDPRASFLCVEPWQGSPDSDGKIIEFKQKRDMLLLAGHTSQSFAYRITVS